MDLIIQAITTKPVITLIGNAEVTITINSPYNDAGATAKDGDGVDITSRIVTVNYSQMQIIGTRA